MRLLVATIAALAGLTAGLPAYSGAPVRYALIIGNDHGQAPPGVQLPDLLHAETEAQRIRERLVSLGNFGPSDERVVLALGKTREQILVAARALVQQHRRDRDDLGEVPTLFAFFFTGHGLDGKLLTASDPLTGTDLATIFEEMSATFTVGVFDACFSGSLDLSAIRGKGLRVLQGFNVFEQLPREVLNSQGTVWFTSSQPEEVSYEDDRLGGVFTHFFLEGMERAGAEGFGVTLEAIWEYARSRTQQYTSRVGRPQTPQKMIRNLTSTGPLYFSFPSPRSAYLVFEPGVSGRFLVRYDSGQLTELIEKQAGKMLRVPVYPAELVLERLDGSQPERQHVALAAGDTVWVREKGGWQPTSSLGSGELALRAKGERLEGLVLTRSRPRWSGLLDLGYGAAFGPGYSAVAIHNVTAGLRLDRDWLWGQVAFSYGHRSEEFDAWGYDLDRADLALRIGPALDLWILRLGLAADVRILLRDVGFHDGTDRLRAGLGLGAAASVLASLVDDPLGLYAVLQGGVRAEYCTPVAPPGADAAWEAVPWFGVGLVVEVF